MSTRSTRRGSPRDVARRLVADAPDTAWLRAVVDDIDRHLHTAPLERLMRLWDLSASEAAALFGVTRQAFAKWLQSGPPADRAPALADLAAATDILDRHLHRERIPAVVRRPAAMLGDRSLYDLARDGRHSAVREAVRTMFDLRRVQP